MSTRQDWLEKALREAFAPAAERPEISASEAPPASIPTAWREELLARVAQRSSELLVQRICEHAEETGWNLDDLAEEARDSAEAARKFLRHGGDPQRLTPVAFAQLFWRIELVPSDWEELLRQTVSAFATIAPPQAGTIMGRTTGLSGTLRSEALRAPSKRHRDPARAVHAAEIFVDEVMSEWKRLTKPKASQNDQQG
jgi:hypothetical protein